jgi:hypothetical protein
VFEYSRSGKVSKNYVSAGANLPTSFVEKDSLVLDFGVGLGRFSEVLLGKELKEGNLSLVDTLDDVGCNYRRPLKSHKFQKLAG